MKVYEDMYLSLGILASKVCELGCTRESMLLNKIVHDIIQKMKGDFKWFLDKLDNISFREQRSQDDEAVRHGPVQYRLTRNS